ncbi:MAG: PilX N-terminal domain-containing pilus assembly protein [Dehalococcoidia bacterium]|jgi:hypothetical protein|nr:PilX N-terminal domain-containing pilus assembly protein [Dehalococcoidia bacterium]
MANDRSPPRGAGGRVRAERGAALLIALMATVLLSALGSALILVTMTETAITVNYRNAEEARYAAEAGLERVVQDLRAPSDWDHVLAGSMRSGFTEGALSPVLPDGTILGLATVTADLQQETNRTGWGPNTPVWRLYAYGPISALVPGGAINSVNYVAVWVADDPAETDGDPLVDRNDLLTLHAVGYGPLHTRKVVEATLARASGAQGGVRWLSWRELR